MISDILGLLAVAASLLLVYGVYKLQEDRDNERRRR